MAQVIELKGDKFAYEGILNIEPSVLIDWFDDLGTNNDYSWLSNFYPAEIEWLGAKFPSSEHAYQAMKYFGTNMKQYELIRTTQDPNEAKYLGRTGTDIRSDWEEVKFNTMRHIVWTKFETHPDLTERLLETNEAYLQEGTFWHDQVWGVELVDETGAWITDPLKRPGTNWLGTILMEIRAKLNLGLMLDIVGSEFDESFLQSEREDEIE